MTNPVEIKVGDRVRIVRDFSVTSPYIGAGATVVENGKYGAMLVLKIDQVQDSNLLGLGVIRERILSFNRVWVRKEGRCGRKAKVG